MKTLPEYLRELIIAPEFVVLLCAAAIICDKSGKATAISKWLVPEPEAAKYAFTIPIILLGYTFHKVSSVLFPASQNKSLLDGWPDYWKLKVTCNVSLVYAGLFALGALLVWANPSRTFDSDWAALLILSLLGSGITAFTVHQASIAIQEVLAQRQLEP